MLKLIRNAIDAAVAIWLLYAFTNDVQVFFAACAVLWLWTSYRELGVRANAGGRLLTRDETLAAFRATWK